MNERWARRRGAVAGLAPAIAVAVVFAVSGTGATPTGVATSLILVTLLAMAAGWIAGPLAATEPHRIVVAALGYAIALIAVVGALSIVQGVADAIASNGFDPVAIVVTAVGGRVVYALAATFYLLLPAIALGALWSLGAHGLAHLAGARSTPPV